MEEITVILNGYKRPEYLKEQVEAIRGQSVKPKEVWLWINTCENVCFPEKIEGIDVVVKSSRNFKYHGRFSLGLLATTKYLAFFDDDTIPGIDWFSNCFSSLKDNPNSIIGGVGVLMKSSKYYYMHDRAGWANPSDKNVEVDLAGHAWFLEKNILNNLWSEELPSLNNGEDIQLSFLSWIKNKVKTICPPHPENNKNMWSSLKAWDYGNDKKASSNGSLMSIPEFYSQRDIILQYYMTRGYTPVLLRGK